MDTITKGQLVNVALKHLAVSGSLINASTEDEYDFLVFLEMMVASWTNKGIQIGYKLSEFGIDPDASEESGIAVDDAAAIALNLATYGASSKGLLVSPNLKGEAYTAYCGLFSAELIQRESNSMLPTGSGNNPYNYWASDFQPIDESITVENDGNLGDLTI
ncbi:tail accessory factor [Vibrio phage 199E37-1]|nr:tail accessory factor [Vibrio phage 199E37-1]